MSDPMTAFARLVSEMREAQRTYFTRGRTPEQLTRSKSLEREVDREIESILAGPGLFDGEAREPSHADRNRLAVFASTTEAIHALFDQGIYDLSRFPAIIRQVGTCHRTLVEMERKVGP